MCSKPKQLKDISDVRNITTQLASLIRPVTDETILAELSAHIDPTRFALQIQNACGIEAPAKDVLDTMLAPLRTLSFGPERLGALSEAVSHLVLLNTYSKASVTEDEHFMRLYVGLLCLRLSAHEYFDESPGVELQALALVCAMCKMSDSSTRQKVLQYVIGLMSSVATRDPNGNVGDSGWLIGVGVLASLCLVDLSKEAAAAVMSDVANEEVGMLPRERSVVLGLCSLVLQLTQATQAGLSQEWNSAISQLGSVCRT
jgi:hypothetical protein